jgi:hypothetical protein
MIALGQNRTFRSRFNSEADFGSSNGMSALGSQADIFKKKPHRCQCGLFLNGLDQYSDQCL